MLLPKLNSAIRAADTVSINFHVGNLIPINVAVQKTSLLEALKDAFPDRGETGLTLTSEGAITRADYSNDRHVHDG